MMNRLLAFFGSNPDLAWALVFALLFVCAGVIAFVDDRRQQRGGRNAA